MLLIDRDIRAAIQFISSTSRCQPVTNVKEPFSSRNVESWESWSFPDISNLDSLVATVLRLPGILSLPGITLPVPVRARMSRALSKFCHAGKRTCALVQCLASLANCSNLVHINHQCGTESTHAGVKQSQLWEKNSLHSFHFRKGSDQWRVSTWQCWKLKKLEFSRHLKPCVRKSLWLLMLLCSGFQESCRCRESRCLFQFEQEWAEHWTNFCILEEQALALVQCLGRLAIWWDIFSTIQFTSITSTQQRAHMQVSSSGHCERTILFTVSIFAKGQINEWCLLGNVESWKSWSFPDTSNLVWGRFSGCSCYCVTASRNLVAARNHVACSSSSKNEQNIEQICVFRKNKHLP